MQAGKLFLAPLLFSSLCLTSCVQSAPKSYAGINGNWHIAGKEGVTQLPLVQSPLLTFAMGVNGKTIYASGNVGVNCSNGGAAIGGVSPVTGQIASDGTFLLSNSAEPLDTIQLTIRGKVPADGATTWTGSYTIVNAVPSTGCVFNDSSDFVATAYPPLNGAYSGMITGPGFESGISVTTQITQGAFTSAALPRSSALVYYTPLSGTIAITGSPTLKTGTTSANQVPWSSSISGNGFILNFVMNDGSTLALSGWFTDSSESTIQVVTGGFGQSYKSNICTLTRQ